MICVMGTAEKRCSTCNTVKPIADFAVRRNRKCGVASSCKSCACERERKYRLANAEHVKARQRANYQARAEINRVRAKEYRQRNGEEINAKQRALAKYRTPEMQAYMRQYREANRERLAEMRRQWDRENPGRVKLQSRSKYLRSKQDASWRLRRVIHAGMWKALKGVKGHGRWFDLLDFTVEELRVHLERQFLKGMSWDNFGEWHVDHIVPLASFVVSGPDDPELKRAWALTNLRPIWGRDNMSKGAKVTTLL